MYVEVSPRQSGKTTRLLEAALKSFYDGEHVAIVAFNENYRSTLTRRLKEMTCSFSIPEVFNRKLNYPDWVKVFIDEFDYHSDLEFLSPNENWYYTTTARKKRFKESVDFFTTLVKKAMREGCLVTSHKSFKEMDEREIRRFGLEQDIIDLNYYNKFGNFLMNRNGANA